MFHSNESFRTTGPAWSSQDASLTEPLSNADLPQLELRRILERLFLDPTGSNIQVMMDLTKDALSSIVFRRVQSIAQGSSILSLPLVEIAQEAVIPMEGLNPKDLLMGLGEMTAGTLDARDVYTAKNIIPNVVFSSLSAHLAISLLMANGVTGEDAGAALNAEVAVSSAMARLAGYDPFKAAGLFTFGGTGTNMYAIKLGLQKAAPDHQLYGVPDDVYIITSLAGHYCHLTAAIWLGIGSERCLKAKTNEDQTTDLKDLESKCRNILKMGAKLATIIASGGTTSNCAIDDIEQIVHLRDTLVKEYSLNYVPHVHVDGVIGWAFLNFKSYDVDTNPLCFSNDTLSQIRHLVLRSSMFAVSGQNLTSYFDRLLINHNLNIHRRSSVPRRAARRRSIERGPPKPEIVYL